MLKVEKGFVRVSFSDIKFIMPFGINYRKLMIIMLGKWLRLSVLVLKNSIFTQAVRPWFKFWLRFFFFFLVQSQIAIWSLKRMRHLCMRTAHGIYRSCRREKLARIP